MTKLWLDLGNTRLKYWLSENGIIKNHDAQLHLQAPAELLMGLSDTFIRLQPTFIGISSVLGDKINAKVLATLDIMGIRYEFAKVHQSHPLIQSHYHPDQLGVDRWLQMLGVVDCSKHQCIIGCGTAMTIDIIEKGVHLGGYIFPNARLQRESLFVGTKQIGQFSHMDSYGGVQPATRTVDAVNHGILLSIIGAIHEVMTSHPNHEFIMTGGDAPHIAQHLNKKVTIRQDLVLEGLQRYFNQADSH
ncbi:type III pantothenate kinase [Moraxella nasovis]|uniref:type III pantothenate kinase n=1 Tax=Moraxella nasovis TaxID=2904121 RepID=UPI001F60FF3E|nr:type III pantothenate kinase [Moraxella nasovis]UNU73851.1 type III pantothenate kinase [Moraxella nasovis]